MYFGTEEVIFYMQNDIILLLLLLLFEDPLCQRDCTSYILRTPTPMRENFKLSKVSTGLIFSPVFSWATTTLGRMEFLTTNWKI